jgi:hypothetical protein
MDDLIDPASRGSETRATQGKARQVPFFAVGGYRVWGATAMILAELAAVWHTAQYKGNDGEEA